MYRTVFSIIGGVMLLVPRQVIEYFEALAFENPEDARLRRWTTPLARLEGLVFLLWKRDGGSDLLPAVLGVFGTAAALAPRRYLRWGLGMAYKNESDLRLRSGMVAVTRVLGLLYLALAVRALLGGDGEATDPE
jgi:hypothetical protein